MRFTHTTQIGSYLCVSCQLVAAKKIPFLRFFLGLSGPKKREPQKGYATDAAQFALLFSGQPQGPKTMTIRGMPKHDYLAQKLAVPVKRL